MKARGVDVVAVATDDERIAAAARSCGARAVMTGPARTGTDRVAEAARKLAPRPRIVVNLQGDEPLIEPAAIEGLLAAMEDPAVEMATLARPLGGRARAAARREGRVHDHGRRALFFAGPHPAPPRGG